MSAFVALQPAPAIDRAANLAELDRRLDALCSRFNGRMGYSLKVLKTGETIGFRENERFPSASTIKTAVMVEAVNQVDEGKLKWTDTRANFPRERRSASMWSFHFRDEVKPNLDAWVNLMITVSDNTATRVVQDWVGSQAINDRMEKLGLKDTKILNTFPASNVTMNRLNRMFGWGMTTPREMNRLLELIYLRKAASPAGCERMIRILSHQYWDDWIGGAVPPGVTAATKSGAISRSRSDTGIVFSSNPYIFTIYTDSQKDRRWVSDNEGDRTIVKASQLVWNTLHPKQPYLPPPGAEKFAPTGGGVEDN